MSRSADLKIFVKAASALNCQDATTRNLLSDGLKNKLEELGSLQCTRNNECEYKDFLCTYDGTKNEITMDFRLKQISNLADKGVIERDVERIKITADGTLTFDINTAKKRALITLTTGSLKSSTVETRCPAKTIEKDNECGVCAPGYGLNTDKDKCVICNYGSWSAGGYVSCTPCVNPSLTTQLLGSAHVLSCIPKTEICVVGGVKSLNGVLVPPHGSRVLKTTSIKSVCPAGFNQEFGVEDNFLCSQKSYPICHSKIVQVF